MKVKSARGSQDGSPTPHKDQQVKIQQYHMSYNKNNQNAVPLPDEPKIGKQKKRRDRSQKNNELFHSWLDGRSFSSQDASIDENLELTNAINYKMLSAKKTQE